MPASRPQGTSRLRIKLENGPVFRPGDTIVGTVTRKEHLVSPRVDVVLTLRGRAKVKITVSRNNSRHHYRGRWNFFENRQCPDVTQHLFNAPLHIPPYDPANINEADWAVWPFAVEIPKFTHMSPRANHGEDGFIDPHRKDSKGNVVLDPLPSSYYSSDHGFSTHYEAYVEYSLEARLTSNAAGSHEHLSAVQPVTLRAAPPTSIVSAHEVLNRRVLYDMVRTQRLEPGMAEAELGFRQKVAKTLSLGSVPSFGFSVAVTTPKRVQLDSPLAETVPFTIKIVPQKDRAPEMSDKMLEEPPVIALAAISLKIRSRTSVQAQGTFSPHTAGGSEKTDLNMAWLIPRRAAPVELPVGEKVQPLDIGALFGLRLGVEASEVLGKQVNMMPKLAESFRTYCVELRHSLIWEIALTIAGEKKTFEGEGGLELIAPAEERAGRGESEQFPAGGSRAAYENGLAPPPVEGNVDDAKVEQPPAYEK